MTDTVRPFRIDVPQRELDDLQARLRATRWPEAETVDDWSQGVPLAYAREFCSYWAEQYDWPARQARLNGFDQFLTTIDGQDIHFVHVQSPEAGARPLLITHGWPGSVVEFVKVLEPLSNPAAHGGSAADAFHLVCPSLPGFGFSGKPERAGTGVVRIAGLWDELMGRLGYDRYYAQGGDWGSAVTTAIGIENRGRCAGIHVNMPNAGPSDAAKSNPDAADLRAFERAQEYQDVDSGYSKQQSTRPQTLGYALADSPAGQAMWVLEKFWKWMDCDGHPENILSRDELLDNIMLYWLTNSGASSGRLYWESFGSAFGDRDDQVALPAGCSIFPKEIVPTPRRWAETRYPKLVYWNELDKGGHFAAFEQPELFVNEMRACFRLMD